MTGTPIKVTYLLAVWGERYIQQFLDLSLRSLLSPGNIPGLAVGAESSFIFLTRKCDRKLFGHHPLFKRLQHYCRVEFITIDDLIFSGNYSATLTLAYDRGMRQGSAAMLSTYFIYLVADYVVADGSLANLLPYMQRGVSGITTGNFQVVEEDLLETFKNRVDKKTGILTIGARALMSLTLPHLHPITVANIVNQNFSHTEHTNRLFWRVDNETLIGRFYLRHMLCIKPEIEDYIIGASCDYSYIAEMCPSGNVVHLTDSDEYCVIELQPFGHEENLIKYGAFDEKEMARSLAKWTTSFHRSNIFNPIVFHGNAISSEAQDAIKKTHDFVVGIDRLLPEETQPVRAHPYWISCIEGILANLTTLNNQEYYFKNGVFGGIVGSRTFEPPLGTSYDDYHLLKMIRYRYGSDWRMTAIKMIRALSGSEAKCKIWHREYAHSRAINAAIAKAAANTERFMFIAYEATSYADWCHQQYGDRAVLQKAELFDMRPVEAVKQLGIGHAVILLPVGYLHKLGEFLAQCNACLEGERRITVIVTQRYFARRTKLFKERLAILAAYYESGGVQVESFTTVTNSMRKWLDGFYQKQVNIVMHRRISLGAIIRRTTPMLMIVLASMGYIVGNIFSRQRIYPHRGDPTCAIITLKLTGNNNIMPHSILKLREEHND